MLNTHMDKEWQVATIICKSTIYYLRNIGMIKHVLIFLHSTSSLFDIIPSCCCNSFLNGILDVQKNKLQRLENIAARIVCKSNKYDHIKPTLQKVHFLPVRSRIQFKTLLYTNRSMRKNLHTFQKC